MTADISTHKYHVAVPNLTIAGFSVCFPLQDSENDSANQSNTILLVSDNSNIAPWALSPKSVLYTTVEHYLYGHNGRDDSLLEDYGITDTKFNDFVDSLFTNIAQMGETKFPSEWSDEDISIISDSVETFTSRKLLPVTWFEVRLGELLFAAIIEYCSVNFTASDKELLQVVEGLIERDSM